MTAKYNMGVQRGSAKTKKPSKLDNLKTLVFGSKKDSSKTVSKSAAKPSKKSEPKKTSASSKASQKMKVSAVRSQSEKHSSKAKVSLAKNIPASKGKGGKEFSTTSLGFGTQASETVCREVACEGLATSAGYCRLHYIKNWKKIKRKEAILREKKLNNYIEELILKYPDKYIEAIRQDLASDKDFAKVIYDLDLDESVDDFDTENAESVDSLIDTIKRDFEDDGEAF